MRFAGNDHWIGTFPVEALGVYRFRIVAWPDEVATWCRDFTKKLEANVDVALDVEEGAQLAESHAKFANSRDRATLIGWADRLRGGVDRRTIEHLDRFVTVARRAIEPPRARSTTPLRPYGSIARSHGVRRGTSCSRGRHRRIGRDPAHSPTSSTGCRTSRRWGSTSSTCRRSTRSGRVIARAATNVDDRAPGSGQPVGDRWRRGWPHRRASRARHRRRCRSLVEAARTHDLEIALDLAFQTSPDHPWVREHPAGSVTVPTGRSRTPRTRRSGTKTSTRSTSTPRTAKASGRRCSTSSDSGSSAVSRVPRRQSAHETVRVLGVDDRVGPRDRSRRHLPRRGLHAARVMERLAKLGFTQSYTYFTWRNEKWEITEYFAELSDPAHLDYFRPNVWPNTPDILHESLQQGTRATFIVALPARRRAQRELRDLRTGVRAPGAHRARSGQRGIPRLGEVRGPALGPRTARQPAPPDRPGELDPRRAPGAGDATTRCGSTASRTT